MSHPNLLGLHPVSLTSFCSTPPQPPQTTCSSRPERASLTGIRTHSSATSLEWQSGYLADSIPLTGYEPKTCIDVSSEHTPINYPYRKNSFNIEDNVTTTVAASETSDGLKKQAAANGSSQFVPTSEVNAWLHAETWSARSRKLLRSDVSNITHVEETYSKGKRDRDLERVRTWSERKDSHASPEQKADLAVREECAPQRRISEAEAGMETRKWEKISSDMCLNNERRPHDKSTWQFTTTITTMITYTTQPQGVGALVTHHPGWVITPVGPGKDTHGTLGPLRRKAVGGPNNAPKGEVTRHDALLEQDNRQVFRQTIWVTFPRTIDMRALLL